MSDHGYGTSISYSKSSFMPRNLDRRVEALAPVKDARLRERLDEIFAIELSDTELAWQLHDDGTWTRVRNGHGVNAQDELYKRAVARAQRL